MDITFKKKMIGPTLFLSLLAYLGNYVSYPLFHSVAFIFGSIAVVYAALSLGRCAAVFVAFVGGIYTFHLWGHAYAIIIFMAEALWISTFSKRNVSQIVLIDLSYWLLLGIPLVFIFYTKFIGLPFNAAALISLKQTLNGVFNALIASFIFIAINVLWHKKQRISIQPLLFNIILFITLVAGAVPSILSTNKASKSYEVQINEELKSYSNQLYNYIKEKDKKNKNTNLETILKSAPNIENISFALLDENNKSFYIHGQVKSILNEAGSDILNSNNNFTIWLPARNLASMKRWRLGRYLYSRDTTEIPKTTKLIVEKSAAIVVSRVNDLKVELFSILSILMFVAILISFLLSRWITRPINNLDKISQELNKNIISGKINSLPSTPISEFSHLSDSLHKMASDISDKYHGLSEEKDHLVAIVDKSNEAFKRLSMVASRTTNCVIITDINGNTEWVNEAFIKLTGFTLNEVVGKKPGDFLQGKDTDIKTVNRISDKLKLNQSFSEDIINYSKSGEAYWVHIDCDPIFEKNELLGFISIESDITKRKEAEEALKSRTDQLNAVLNAATEISVIATDTNGLITTANTGSERMLGYSKSDLVNKENPAIFHLESEVILRGHELSKQLGYEVSGFNTFITIPNLKGSETREWTYIKKDGSHIIVLLSVTPMLSNNNDTIGYLGVAQDITERKRLDNMKREFVSTVSHELRTPLTSINGTLGLIHGGAVGELPEQAKDMLNVAIDNTKRLTLLINDLLDMDKIASGKMDFELNPQVLMPLIEQSIQANKAYAEQYDVTYELISRCDEATANIDPNRFLQIMANFLSNAAKFSHAGSAVDIKVTCTNDNVKILFKITVLE